MPKTTQRAIPLFFLTILMIAGCGVDQERFGEEAKAARAIVPGLSGFAKCDPQKFAATFVQGKAPMANRVKYAMLEMVANTAKINGDEATLEVSLFNPITGEKIADQQWTAKKIDNSWKLQDAPLP